MSGIDRDRLRELCAELLDALAAADRRELVWAAAWAEAVSERDGLRARLAAAEALIETRWRQLAEGGCSRSTFLLMGEHGGPTYGELLAALAPVEQPAPYNDPNLTHLGCKGGACKCATEWPAAAPENPCVIDESPAADAQREEEANPWTSETAAAPEARPVRVKRSRDSQVDEMRADPAAYFTKVREKAKGHRAAPEVTQ